MFINEKLTKQITEAKYLTAENAWRYRSIIRYFYLQYEKIKYWMYKEEVLEELKKHPTFKEYTIDQCKQDLDALVEWGNLIPVQDTKKASTVEEFKNKQFRYQLSEYGVEIERLTIRLENLKVEGASLEPTLLERIKNHLEKISLLQGEEEKNVDLWWQDLNTDFKRLNQNYQDYVRELHSLRAEEMMKTRAFLIFKDKFIDYLRDFVKGLQENSYAIEQTLGQIQDEHVNNLLEKVLIYQENIPRIDEPPEREVLWDSIQGRWENLKSWFLGDAGESSESSKLFDMTNDIIRKITRYAAQIVESRNSAANRKEEYKKLCNMFLETKNIKEAHQLSALAFGIFHTKHIVSEQERETESINSSVYEEKPIKVSIKPRIRAYREKMEKNSIPNHAQQKQKMLAHMIEKRKQEQEIMASCIVNGKIDFSKLPVLQPHMRNTLLRWLSKGMNATNKKAKTEEGIPYRVVLPRGRARCILKCDDGDFEMPAYSILFEEQELKA